MNDSELSEQETTAKRVESVISDIAKLPDDWAWISIDISGGGEVEIWTGDLKLLADSHEKYRRIAEQLEKEVKP